MHVARRRGFGRVHISVCVQPEVADLLFILAEIVGDAGSNARGNGVVPAEDQREKAFT